MVSVRRSLAFTLVCSSVFGAATALAQDATTNTVKKEVTDIKPPENTLPNGTYASLRGDLTFSFTDTQKVVGQPDGTTLNFGVKVDGHVDVIHDEHEWRNWVLVNAGLTKTPTIPEFLKNNDSLLVESIYLYHVKPWIGPFAKLRLETPMFAGSDVRPTPVNYVVKRQNGTVDQSCDPNSNVPCTTSKFALSDAFSPLTLKESLGAFAQPYKSVPITIEARLGLGGQQILADKQFAVSDVPDNNENCPAKGDPTKKSAVPCIEVTQLSDVLQLGVEANLEVWGSVYEKKVNYRLYAGILAPFAHGALPKVYTDAGGKDDMGQLTNVDLGANVNFKLVEWASLGYEFKAVRVPALLPDTFQVRNTVFFTMGFGVDNHPPPPPPPAAPAAAPPAK